MTSDLLAATDKYFLMFNGFEFTNGQYYARNRSYYTTIEPVHNELVPIDANLVMPIANKNGMEVILVAGKNEFQGPPIWGTAGKGSVGAILNFPSGSEYLGMSCQTKNEYKSEFITILENLRWSGS